MENILSKQLDSPIVFYIHFQIENLYENSLFRDIIQ